MKVDYESMSDFEINKAVAAAWLPCDYDFDDKAETVDLVGYVTYLGAHGTPDERLEKYGEFNPCNNPSDAWPIIIEHGICIEKRSRLTDFWVAITWHQISGNEYRPIHQHIDKNPLRAAIIVFLMMNEQ